MPSVASRELMLYRSSVALGPCGMGNRSGGGTLKPADARYALSLAVVGNEMKGAPSSRMVPIRRRGGEEEEKRLVVLRPERQLVRGQVRAVDDEEARHRGQGCQRGCGYGAQAVHLRGRVRAVRGGEDGARRHLDLLPDGVVLAVRGAVVDPAQIAQRDRRPELARRPRRRHHGPHRPRPSRLPEDGDAVWVAAEVADVRPHPVQRIDLVRQPEVAVGHAVVQGQESQRRQPVVDVHHHHVAARREIAAVRRRIVARAAREGPPMDPEHDGLEVLLACGPLAARAGQVRRPDVQEEAVFGSPTGLHTLRAVRECRDGLARPVVGHRVGEPLRLRCVADAQKAEAQPISKSGRRKNMKKNQPSCQWDTRTPLDHKIRGTLLSTTYPM
ncbi:hypothetical protein VTK73DRAFT_2831 [Phialemonium thermophilum]|uniref:Uncharacterized protein n=1 Tax=Phialemonium thermophilum TaxID=223376 RepID=A0ABR3VPE0_9PEZI